MKFGLTVWVTLALGPRSRTGEERAGTFLRGILSLQVFVGSVLIVEGTSAVSAIVQGPSVGGGARYRNWKATTACIIPLYIMEWLWTALVGPFPS